MNVTKRFVEAIGCKRVSIRERSALCVQNACDVYMFFNKTCDSYMHVESNKFPLTI